MEMGLPEFSKSITLRSQFNTIRSKRLYVGPQIRIGFNWLGEIVHGPWVREAYECLIDKEKRSDYDSHYFDLKDQWTEYWEWQETQHKYENKKRAEEEQRVARERAEREKKAAEVKRARKMEEEKRVAKEKAERERIREERIRQAEERSREAARRARVRQEQAARERLHKEKEKEAEKRSEEAARKIRIEQEQAAQERLKNILIQQKQYTSRRNWAKLREAAEHRDVKPEQPAPSRSHGCAHPQFGWPKKKNGRASCVFCGETRTKWSFCCPECDVSACPACNNKYYMGYC
ncbi:DnaJ-domain-containing protein [Zalerion maritima]|uniref:DnaJ-domain-containing protein n=1 Tax=Zalerion maritima TaxID=339359 RepID=A0AAD5RRS7_9PEZI|nr:DnaJ-domain-containing protein [Zalerion maritima]